MATLNVAGTASFTGAAAADPRMGGVRGIVQQYGTNNQPASGPAGAAISTTRITPADGTRIGTPGGNANVTIAGQPGTYASSSQGGTGTGIAGSSGPLQNSQNIKQTNPLLQNATDLLIVGQKSTNQADNFLNCTVTSKGSPNSGQTDPLIAIPVMNSAQLAAAGKSMNSGAQS
jgi:hypothetical protein